MAARLREPLGLRAGRIRLPLQPALLLADGRKACLPCEKILRPSGLRIFPKEDSAQAARPLEADL